MELFTRARTTLRKSVGWRVYSGLASVTLIAGVFTMDPLPLIVGTALLAVFAIILARTPPRIESGDPEGVADIPSEEE